LRWEIFQTESFSLGAEVDIEEYERATDVRFKDPDRSKCSLKYSKKIE